MKTTIAAIARRARSPSLLLAAFVATWSTLGPNVAQACGFIAYREVQPVRPPQLAPPPTHPTPPVTPSSDDLIASAERQIEDESFAKAAAGVLTAFPRLVGAEVGASPLERRAQRILVLALVRSDGALPGVAALRDASPSGRAAHLEWAVATMRVMESLYAKDPVAQADLGEALAKLPKYEDEALGVLAPLAERDLLGSAHAYATLARLRGARGEGAAQDDATRRCRQMTKVPDRVCGPEPRAPADATLASRS